MTTPYPTLPSTWSPSSQCIASTAFYYVVERTFTISETIPAGIIFSLMYGIPTPTVYGTITNQTPSGTCVPPSFTTDVPYITDSNSCPTGYSIACASGSSYSGAAASAITCCPRQVTCFICILFLCFWKSSTLICTFTVACITLHVGWTHMDAQHLEQSARPGTAIGPISNSPLKSQMLSLLEKMITYLPGALNCYT